jgi:lipopolysaccharide export LptBFGC system permease protein LptF
LNIMELRALMKGDGAIFAPLADPWEVAVNYYGRFALSLAPMAFVLLARSAAALDRRSGRIVLIATAVSYFPVFLTPDAYLRTLPPLLLAWFPPAMVVAVALLLRRFGRQRPTPA